MVAAAGNSATARTQPDATAEVETGHRFAFGNNWQAFVDLVDAERVDEAQASLRDKLHDIRGRSLLDVGSGSGLFSLAARNLGATVVSFDYDPASVECTQELRRRYRPDDPGWTVLSGSALDADFLAHLGQFDVVYSWGVLHHTGAMWTALENVAPLVAPGGRLFISIYNDQGLASRAWRGVKRSYCGGGRVRRQLLLAAVTIYFSSRAAAGRAVGRSLPGRGSTSPRGRGMDERRDLVDWVGGYPFEVAKPEQVFAFFRKRGFVLDELVTRAGGLGCNEFVFTRTA